MSLKNWKRMRSSSWRTTKVPLPCRRTTRFSAASSSSALRTVPCETPRSAAMSGSLGSVPPAAHTPSAMRRISTSLTCRYSGRKPSAARLSARSLATTRVSSLNARILALTLVSYVL
jgi:hypothetical protein